MERIDAKCCWRWYQAWIATCAILLFAVTWRLWTPQSVFPQIPLFGWAVTIGPWIDWAGLLAISIGLCGVLFTLVALPSYRKTIVTFWLLFVSGLGSSLLVDQHRLQPWAYQFCILAIFYCAFRDKEGLFWTRSLTISIYLYSAVGKFDAQFVHTVGQDFLHASTRFLWINSQAWSESTQLFAASLFPGFELIVGLLLLFSRTRRAGQLAATVLHTSLLVLLGPLGLNHRWGVLAWNIFFIGQVWILFRKQDLREVANTQVNAKFSQYLKERVGRGVALFVLVFPLTERIGYCDHWLAWALYAPHSSRVEIYLHSPSESQSFSPYLTDLGKQFDGWNRLRIGDWSLGTLTVPVYPQARFQIGVAKAVAEKNATRIDQWSSAARVSGVRRIDEDVKLDDSTTEQFWLNTKPRTANRVQSSN